MAGKPTPYRAKDGAITYSVRFRPRGRKNPVKETFGPFPGDPDGTRALAEARKFAALVDQIGGDAARAQRTAGQGSARTTPTLATWLETHLEQVSASATSGTVAEYRRMAARTWLPTLGPLPIDVVDRAAIVRWVAWQRQQTTSRGRPYSPKSIENAHGLLSAALSSAVEAELIARNPARGVPLPSDAERAEMVILTESEWVKLHAAVPARWQPLVALLYGTGLRWGEATALTPGDLDLDSGTPVLRVTRAWKKGETGVYLGSPKTLRGRRTVSLPAELVPALRMQAEGKAASDLLFTAAEGGRVSHQHFHTRVWKPSLERSGIGKKPRIHDLRHCHASWCLNRRMDMLTLQHRLGHESLKVTGDTYGHLQPDVHERSAAIVTGMLAGSYPEIES